MERMGGLPTERRTEMGRAARAKVERQFSDEVVVQAYLDVLADATAVRQAAR
jgi:hypothetical protein